MPRARGRGAHASINMSPMEMLAGEVEELAGFVGKLEQLCGQLGGPADCQQLRNTIMDAKMNLANAEQSISARLKMEVSPEDFDAQADLEDRFFELKTNYFAVLRYCTTTEAQTPLPVAPQELSYQQQPEYATADGLPQQQSSYAGPGIYAPFAEPPSSANGSQGPPQYQQQPQYGQVQPQYDQQQPQYDQQQPQFDQQQPPYDQQYQQVPQPQQMQQPPQQPQYAQAGGGPNIQRYGNPHTSPALQNMGMGASGGAPPPVSRAAKPPDSSDHYGRAETKSLPATPASQSGVPPQRYSEPVGPFPPSPDVNRRSKPLPPPPGAGVAQYGQQASYGVNANEVTLNQEQQFAQIPMDGQQQQQQVQQQAVTQQDLDIDGVKLTYRDSVYWDTKEVVERNQEMQELSKEMVHLTEVFQDVAVEVDTQMEQVEQAEEMSEVAQENTKQAVKTMGRTAKTAKKVLLPGVGGGAGAVSGAVVGGIIGSAAGGLIIPGAVIGAGVGAAAGGVVGHGFGMVLRMHTDKDMHKARLSEQWAPDKSTKLCMGCSKKFTTTKRRHHCRNCGGIFCGKCTKHRMNIPGVEAENRPRVCNQCFEALMYHQQGVKPPPNWVNTWVKNNELPEVGGPTGPNDVTGPMGAPPPLPSAASKPLPPPPASVPGQTAW